MSMTVKRKFRVERREKGRKEVCNGEAKAELPVERVPRISRLMSLAIRFDEMIRTGEVKDQAELARLGHVTRARMTQITALLSLAPDIQEQLLSLPASEAGRQRISERILRSLAAKIDWTQQRKMWTTLVS